MYKLSGAVLIIIMSSYYGFYLTRQLKERINVIDAYIYTFDYLESQIKYGLVPLPDICNELAHNISNNIVGQMYGQVYAGLTDESDRESTFYEIWLEESDKLLKYGFIKKEELKIIEEIGQINTYIDRQLQLKCIDNVIWKLKNIYSRLQSELKTKSRIYQVSGVMAGIILTIILA